MRLCRSALFVLASCLLTGTVVMADGPRISLGFQFGVPVRPHYHHYHYRPRPYCAYDYYYRPYPVYVERPVVVRPRPVYIQEREVVAQPASQPQTAPPTQTFRQTSNVQTAPPPLAVDVKRDADVEQYMQRLKNPDGRIRADAAVQLGRLRAEQAVYELSATVTGDTSAEVREAAARGLGLIGSTKGIAALTHAAQSDADRDVRRSAQFAVDVIQTQQRR